MCLVLTGALLVVWLVPRVGMTWTGIPRELLVVTCARVLPTCGPLNCISKVVWQVVILLVGRGRRWVVMLYYLLI